MPMKQGAVGEAAVHGIDVVVLKRGMFGGPTVVADAATRVQPPPAVTMSQYTMKGDLPIGPSGSIM